MRGLEVVRQWGTVTPVGAVSPARAQGRPPGGARVQAAQWRLNAALARHPEAEVYEVAGVLSVCARVAVDLAVWSAGEVRGVHLAAGETTTFRGDPVLLVGMGRIEAAQPSEPPSAWVDVLPGPDLGVFASDTLWRFVDTEWRVAPASNRVGVRLQGPGLRAPVARMPTAPMALGAVEVPPDGLPIVLGPDHPVTGGYPLLAVLPAYATDDLNRVAYGAPVAFRLVDRDTALARWAAWRARREGVGAV